MNFHGAFTLAEMLDRACESAPERVAFDDGEVALSYRELGAKVRALASGLVSRGVKRGDRVAFFLENSSDCPVCLFATLRVGAAYTFINPQTKEDKLRFLLEDAQPTVVITEGVLARRFQAALTAAKSTTSVLCRGQSVPEDEPFEPLDDALSTEPVSPPEVLPVDLAALIYTSGSTGRPKGVMMTHQSMLYSIGALVRSIRLEEGFRTLSVLPFSFNYGMYQMLLSTAISGTLFIERSFTYPKVTFERMAKVECQVFPGVPTIFARLCALSESTGEVLPSVLRLTNTAAALSEELVQKMEVTFPQAKIFRMYGLTECKRALYLEPEMGRKKPGSVGKALPGAEVFLRTPDGLEPSPGEPGILHVRSPGLMLGYWNLPEESAKVLIEGRYPGERVFVTGDFLKCDPEGYFTFVGRSDDIIKTRGEKVSPAEVEEILYGIPGLVEAAVIGVPDEILGEAVIAYLSFESGAELSSRELKRHCAARLEGFMVPQEFRVLPALPKTDTGKIKKSDLRRLAAEPA